MADCTCDRPNGVPCVLHQQPDEPSTLRAELDAARKQVAEAVAARDRAENLRKTYENNIADLRIELADDRHKREEVERGLRRYREDGATPEHRAHLAEQCRDLRAQLIETTDQMIAEQESAAEARRALESEQAAHRETRRERDEANKRAQSAETQRAQMGAMLDWISDALDGREVSDFGESFAIVREVIDLCRVRAHNETLTNLLNDYAGQIQTLKAELRGPR